MGGVGAKIGAYACLPIGRHRKSRLTPPLLKLGTRGRFPSVLKNTRHKGRVFLTAPQDMLSDLSETKWRGILRLRIRTNNSFAPTRPVIGQEHPSFIAG